MEQRFHIGEIADLLEIPASKLRYWESQGLLRCDREPENAYRQYTVSDLMTLSDLSFYRNLGLSVRQVANLESLALEEHQQLCRRQITALQEQRRTLIRQQRRLERYLRALETIEELGRQPFVPAAIDTACIVAFSLTDTALLKQYTKNPYLYSRVQDSADLSREQRGLTVPPETVGADAEILWQDHGGTYVAALMRETVAPDYPNDLADVLAAVQREHATGTVISRFLARARENGVLYDFYKCYIEIV